MFQMLILMCVCVFRVVGGALGDGHACRAACRQQCWSTVTCPCVWVLCCPDCLHPPGVGGTVCFPTRPTPPLVSQVQK